MTTKDAVKQLEMVAKICTTTPLAEAALMGARALEADSGGCTGCKHENKMPWKKSCLHCKYCYRSSWERGDKHEGD